MNKLRHETIDNFLRIISVIKENDGVATSRKIQEVMVSQTLGKQSVIKMIERANKYGFIIRAGNFKRDKGYEYRLPSDEVIESLEEECRDAYDRMVREKTTNQRTKRAVVSLAGQAIMMMGIMNNAI